MSNVLDDWASALQTLIETTFASSNVQVIQGEGLGPSRDRDRVYIFDGPFVPDTDVNDARPRMIVRYLKKLPKTALQDVPNDPSPIRQLILDLAAMFQPKLTTLGVTGLAYFHVDSVTPDFLDQYGVEVSLTGWMRNPMETGG